MNTVGNVLALWDALSGWKSRLMTTGGFTLETRQREAGNLLRIIVERDILPNLENDPLVGFWLAKIIKRKSSGSVEFVGAKGYVPDGEDQSWLKMEGIDHGKETPDLRGIYFFLNDAHDTNCVHAWGVTSGGQVVVCRIHFTDHPTEVFCSVIKDCEIRAVSWDELEKGDFPVGEMIECLDGYLGGLIARREDLLKKAKQRRLPVEEALKLFKLKDQASQPLL